MYWTERLHVAHRAWRYRLKAERAEIRFLMQHLKRGHVAVDIGAYKGAYTYWMQRLVGRGGRVLACEPQPELAGYLETMFSSPSVTVANLALSSKQDRLSLMQPDWNPTGGATLEKVSKSVGEWSVQTKRLDDVLAEQRIERIDFIKCDVEGHELDVFRGAEQTLARYRPVLLFECQDYRRGGGNTDRVFEFVQNFGYEGFFFQGNDLRPVSEFQADQHQTEWSGNWHDNFAFLPASEVGSTKEAA